jgi:hypothetical protein
LAEASNTRFLLERELEVRRWQTIRNTNCTDLTSFNDRDVVWRKFHGTRINDNALNWWPGVKYTPKYLFENHRTKQVTFDFANDLLKIIIISLFIIKTFI